MYYISGELIIRVGLISYIVGRAIMLGITFKNQKAIYWLKEILKFLFVLYMLMVVSVTLFPLGLPFGFYPEYIKNGLNLIPFVSIIKDISQIGIAYGGDAPVMIGLIVRNVGGNILLLMPLGVLVPILFHTYRHLKKIVILGLLTSISIESIQILEIVVGAWGRTVDIDDVICNVLGATLGYLIYKITFKLADIFQIKIVQNLKSEQMKS